MQTRRVFLGSTAALGVVGAATVFRASAQDHDHAASDPVMTELRQQMTTAIRSMAKGGGGGEPARRIAGVLRVAKAAGVARQFDAQLRAAVRRHGRDALLLQTPDPEKFAALVKAFGITQSFSPTPSTEQERARVLDAVLTRGVGPLLDSTAARLEAIAPELDRRRLTPVAQVNPADPCWQPCSEVFAVEVMMIIACLGSSIDFGISCFFLTGMYIGLRLGYAAQGCLC